jgi:hypothetical protein
MGGVKGIGLSVVLIAALSGSSLVDAQSAVEPVPVLLELFTSEGCNSCPPADGLLALLQQEQPIKGAYLVALSEHVTYWDHQGWKDPFGSQQFTARQQRYGRRFNLDSIYTPQLIIDGSREFVGSDKGAIERALRDAAKAVKPALRIELGGAGTTLTVSASGPGLLAERDADLWVAITEDNLVVDVKRGENANRTLRHSGVVRILETPGAGSTIATVRLDPQWRRENLRVVAFVQSRKNHKILSVAAARL